jgi:2-oxo-3-hexenedioate decarboxylase
MELGALTVEVELDGKLVAQGSSASILDHPLQALLAAARLASDAGHPLEAGTIVLTGSATEPVVLSAGSHMAVHFAQLGSVGFSVGPN